MKDAVVTVAVEGPTDLPVARKILEVVGGEMGIVYARGGKSGLDQRIASYNKAAARSPWLVLRDLDHDAPCASAIVASLVPVPAPRMCFRVAVRETESWLLADRERLAAFLGVSVDLLPLAPDTLDDPKRALVGLALRSRRRVIREEVAPPPGSTALIGPGYVAHVQEFVDAHWRPRSAARSSPSLARCLAAVERLLGMRAGARSFSPGHADTAVCGRAADRLRNRGDAPYAVRATRRPPDTTMVVDSGTFAACGASPSPSSRRRASRCCSA